MNGKQKAARLEVVHPDCAGIDVGKSKHYVAVDPSRFEIPVRHFGSFTVDLKQMAEWLTSWGVGRTCPAPPAASRLRSLYDCLREVPEYRSARGVRHSLASVLAIAAAAKLAGAQGPTAIAEFAARLTPRQLAAARWRWPANPPR